MDYAPLLQAISFAADKHRNQRRKDTDASPYINHPIAVANILASEADIQSRSVLLAAILHDTVEDTDTSFEELESIFGVEVSAIVRELTDDKSLPKATRKELQIEHAKHASSSAKLIKIADKISNIRDILNNPPHDWTDVRKQEYLGWATKVVDGCRDINPKLDNVYDSLIQSRVNTLNS